jgi:hypothetical protein
MLIWAPERSSRAMNSSLVNCDPWSVLKIPGVPYRWSASCYLRCDLVVVAFTYAFGLRAP